MSLDRPIDRGEKRDLNCYLWDEANLFYTHWYQVDSRTSKWGLLTMVLDKSHITNQDNNLELKEATEYRFAMHLIIVGFVLARSV